MPRLIDADCLKCDYRERDKFYMSVPEVLTHKAENGETHTLQQVLLARSRNSQWSDQDAVVVFRKPDGSLSYPARNDKPTPAGCERVVMRSLREVERFERKHNVRNEAMWFDRNGRGFENDSPRSPRPRYDTFSE